MEKAKYVIVNTDGEYFVEVSRINTTIFSKNKLEAREMSYEDGQDAMPVVEGYCRKTCLLEEVY